MMVAELLHAKPAYVPPGYRFIRRLKGRSMEGFPGEDDQVLLIYGRGWSDEDARRPLHVFVSPPTNGAQLFSTEAQAGEPVDIGLDGARAVYHDGRWEVGLGEDMRDTAALPVHWDSTEWHSVTAQHASGLYAVRGSRKNGVGIQELVDVVRSLPY